MKIVVALLTSLILTIPAYAKHIHREKYYQDLWCKGKGQTEYILPDKTRCDCLTDINAVEADFADKWYEAIGQSLYYGLQTGKHPGVLLIIESNDYFKYWIRLNSTIQHFGLPIDTWKINP